VAHFGKALVVLRGGGMAEAAAMMEGRKGESWRPEPSSSDGACGRFMRARVCRYNHRQIRSPGKRIDGKRTQQLPSSGSAFSSGLHLLSARSLSVYLYVLL
jgi:hypothetical protein